MSASTSDCPVSDPAPGSITSSRNFATLWARVAVAGLSLGTITESCGLCVYLLIRWGLSRPLPDLAAVVLFLRQVVAAE